MGNNEGLEKKRLFQSSFVAIISFAINILIGFWLSPFIVSKLGSEAHGFSSLGGNITTYMSLITVAVNSFAARYISIEVQKKNFLQASKYFTSVLYANIIIGCIMIVPMVVVVANVSRIFSIADFLVTDVKIQWTLLFAAWLIELLFKVFTTATFVRNRLDINHGLTAISHILRLVTILILFLNFTPRLWYIGVATLICTLFVDAGFFVSKCRLMPEIKICRKNFDLNCLKTLSVKGVWNSFNQLSATLMNGLDLMITNWVINGVTMGYYSIAQTIPTYLQSLMYTICEIFTPNLTIFYAKGQNDKVQHGLQYAMRFNAMLLMVPLLGFFVYGKDFYRLWQYSLEPEVISKINILSILVILPMLSSIFVQPLLTVNTITARLKLPVLVNFTMGVTNIVVEIILVKTTSLGIYAIAGVSSVLLLLRNYLFYPIYSAKNLNLPAKTFYPDILWGLFSSAVVFAFLYVTHLFVRVTSWGTMIGFALVFGLLAELLVFFLLFRKQERKDLLNKILHRGV